MSKVLQETGSVQPAKVSKQRRPNLVAEQLRELIVRNRLEPGDRLPAEWLVPERLRVSRGTLREALKVLESQGLTRTKTGPGGGVFVASVNSRHAIRLLDNLFLFRSPSIADIYAIRKLLEPELAASVAGKLDDSAIEALQGTIRLYEEEPATAEEEYQQRLAELDFHAELARHCDNRLLGFVCEFLSSLLQDMTVCRDIYSEPNPDLRESGLNYQIRLFRAIRSGNGERARQIMFEHMIEAERYMLEKAAMRDSVRDRKVPDLSDG